MNHTDVRGKKIEVEPYGENERDKYGNIIKKNSSGQG
jgi:hypothetical protein